MYVYVFLQEGCDVMYDGTRFMRTYLVGSPTDSVFHVLTTVYTNLCNRRWRFEEMTSDRWRCCDRSLLGPCLQNHDNNNDGGGGGVIRWNTGLQMTNDFLVGCCYLMLQNIFRYLLLSEGTCHISVTLSEVNYLVHRKTGKIRLAFHTPKSPRPNNPQPDCVLVPKPAQELNIPEYRTAYRFLHCRLRSWRSRNRWAWDSPHCQSNNSQVSNLDMQRLFYANILTLIWYRLRKIWLEHRECHR